MDWGSKSDAAHNQGSQVLPGVKGRFAFPKVALDTCCAPGCVDGEAASVNQRKGEGPSELLASKESCPWDPPYFSRFVVLTMG